MIGKKTCPLRLSLLLLLILPALWLRPAAAEPATILVVGDSISAGYGIDVAEGWVSLLQQRLETSGFPQRVVNASISGDTTSGGRARLPAALKRHQPAVVILELGGNDGLRGLPLEEIKDNLEAMIEMSQGAGAHVVLLGMRIPPNYGPRYTEKFRAVYGELAEQYELPLVSFLLEGVALAPGMMQSDRIHPNARAQPVILDNVWPVLEPLLGEI